MSPRTFLLLQARDHRIARASAQSRAGRGDLADRNWTGAARRDRAVLRLLALVDDHSLREVS
jgi:hypothetical protein